LTPEVVSFCDFRESRRVSLAASWPRQSAIIVAAASAARIEAIDAAYFTAVKDAEAASADALIARELGFSGKLVLHPNQLAPVNEVFTPTAAEVAKARRIIDDLFGAFLDDPRLLPPQYQAKAHPEEQPRWIAHYIAGMTDRYAFSEHARLVKNRSIENESLQLFP